MRQIKEVNEKINRYSKYHFDAKSYLIHNYVNEDKAIIPIHINSIDEIYSNYNKNKIELNSELVEYIKNITYYIPYQYSIVFEIDGVNFTDEEKVQIASSLKDYFGMAVYDKRVELKFNNKKAKFLLITGIIILCISFLISGNDVFLFIKEILSIIGTFAIWEFVDTVWFDRTVKKTDVLNAAQVATATIDFIDIEKDKSDR